MKITVDKALIEHAIAALESLDGLDTETECVTIHVGDEIDALRAALAEHGCKFPICQTEEYQQMLAAQVARDLFDMPAEVPMLTADEYTALAHRIASKYAHRSDPKHIAYTFLPHTLEQFVREIEAAVRRKAGL